MPNRTLCSLRFMTHLLSLMLLSASVMLGTHAVAQDGTPPTTVVTINESTLDDEGDAGPRFMRINFDALSSATHTVSVSWDSDADVRFSVFDQTTNGRLNNSIVRDSNPGTWAGDLVGGQPYSVRVWSSSGVANITVTLEANVPLEFSQQPASLSVTEGDSTSFSVAATGSGTYAYQWFADGVALGGETSATLVFAGAVLVNDGVEYTASVSNGFETIVSSAALLEVEAAPTITITTQPDDVTVVEGEDALFTVVANGTGTLSYQWFSDAVAITGAIQSTLAVNAVALDASGTVYSVVISNANETLPSDSATLTVDPTPLPTTVVTIDESTLDSTQAVGPRFMRINFDALSSATHTVSVAWDSDADVRFSVFDQVTGDRLNSSIVRGSNPGAWTGDLVGGQPYSVNAWASSGVASITVSIEANVPFSIQQQPASVTVTEGDSATFTVVAAGSGPLTYQWFADGVALGGETTPTLTLVSTTLTNDGSVYSVDVSNGMETLSTTPVTLNVDQSLPETVVVVGEATLDSARTAGPRFMRFNFDALSTSTHTISVVWDTDAEVRYNVFDDSTGTRLNASTVQGNNPGVWEGDLVGGQPYSIRMWSASGIANVTASIEASVPITISRQPTNVVVTEGDSATFFVDAIGSGALGYQWLVNGTPLAGQTSATLTVLNTTLADDGLMYSVEISNSVATVHSEVAFLIVNEPATRGIYSTEADSSVYSLAGPAPTLDFNSTRPGDAWARRLLRIDDLLLVGGDFTGVVERPFSLDVISSPFLAALDAVSGQPVSSFQIPPEVNSVVRALVLSPSGQQVYVGGDFGVLVLDAITGELDISIQVSEQDQPGRVFDIAVTDTQLYIGGDFSNVNGSFRANIARLSLDGELDNAWAPEVTNGFSSGRSGPVQAITVSPLGDVVYVGGNYSFVDGVAVDQSMAGRDVSLLPLSAVDGSVLPERFIPFTNVDRDVFVHDIAVTDEYVIIAWGGPNVLSFHLPDGTRLQQYRAKGDVQALEVVGNNVLVGHHGEFFGFLPTPIPLEAVDPNDPEVFIPHRLHVFSLETQDFAPGQSFRTLSPFGIWGIAAADDGIWVGGQIENAGTNELPVDGLARFPALD